MIVTGENKFYLSFCLLVVISLSVPIYILWPVWNSVSELANDKYIINANYWSGNATITGEFQIVQESTTKLFGSKKELVRSGKPSRDANMYFLDSQVVLVAAFIYKDDITKTYFLLNLDNPLEYKLELFSKHKFEYDSVMSVDSSESYVARSQYILERKHVVRVNLEVVSPMSNRLDWDFFVLNADKVSVSFDTPRKLIMSIRWRHDQLISEYCLILPRDVREFIEPCIASD